MSKDLEKSLLDGLAAELIQAGFRRAGKTFYADRGDVVLIVNVQKGQKSSAEMLVATVNLGAFSKVLGGDNRAPDVFRAHWRRRLGNISPDARDRWWEVGSVAEATGAAKEIVSLLRSHGLPALEAVSSTAQLRDLWASGACPGLTDGQRLRYLAQLETANDA